MTSDDTAILSTYKQTELGHVPAAWEVKALRDFAHIETGSTPPTADPKNYGDEHLFVSPGDMGVAKWITRTEKRLSAKGFAASRRFPQGSVLFVCIGSTIGKCGVASTELTSNQQINAVLPGCVFSSDFLYYALSAATPRVRALAGEQAVPMVNKSGFAETKVALPPVEEQRAIAEALSDTDAVIEGLDRLIAKKRDLKQAAMQQFLNGNSRLPGYSSAWETVRLAEISAFITKGSTPTTYGFAWQSTGVLFLRSECVSPEGLNLAESMFISEEAHLTLRRSAVRSNDLLITITGNVGRVVRLPEDFGEANINQHIARIRIIDESMHPNWVYHYLSQPRLRRHFEKITTGQAYPQVSLAQVRNAVIPRPTIGEQQEISASLDEMDEEITRLVARRCKTGALKQAMMQELLTGRIRLI